MHDSRGIEIVNFTTAAPLSAGTLMASAGTPYRLVPAHFYPCFVGRAIVCIFVCFCVSLDPFDFVLLVSFVGFGLSIFQASTEPRA